MEVPRERSRSPPTSLVVWRWCWKKTPDTHTWYWEWFPVTTAWIRARTHPAKQNNNVSAETSVTTTHSSSSSTRAASENHRTERGSVAVRREQIRTVIIDTLLSFHSSACKRSEFRHCRRTKACLMPAILFETEAVKFAFIAHAGRCHEAVALVLFASSTTIPLVSITIQIIYSIFVSLPMSAVFSEPSSFTSPWLLYSTSTSMRASHLVLPVEMRVVQPESFKLSQIDVDPVADVDAEKSHLHDGLVLSQEAPRL